MEKAGVSESGGIERDLLDAVPAHVALLDRDGRIVAVNAAWERFARDNGVSEVAMVGVGTNYLAACVPALEDRDAAAVFEGISRVLRGDAARFEHEYPCRGPLTERWFLATVTKTEGGALVAHSNVTGLHQAERVLAHQNRVLALVASNAALEEILGGICELVGVTVPGAYCSILLAVGDHLELAVGPTLPAAYNEALGLVPVGPRSGSCGTAAFRGEPVIVHDIATDPLWEDYRGLALSHGLRACWSFPIRTAQGKLVGTFAVYRKVVSTPDSYVADVMANAVHLAGLALEHDASRTALQASEERFRLLVEGVSDSALFLVSPIGIIVTWNPGAEKLFGATAAEVIGAHIERLFPDDSRELAELELARTSGHHEGETQCIRSDKSRFRAQVSSTLLRNADGSVRGYGVLVRDLSEREMLERQLRQAQKMEAVGQLAGGVAHDFNNILTVIGCCTEALAAELPSNAPLQEMVVEIRHAAERATSLTNQLLAFSRRHPVRPVVLDLNEVIEQSEAMLHRLLGEDIVLETSFSARQSHVRIDRSLVEQIIMNLCVNARDAMPHGGRLSVATRDTSLEASRTETGDLPPGDYVEVSITDTGPGIPESIRGRIFEPFFTTKGTKGTGLGLAVVYGAVKQCGGGLEVHCPPDGGTTMRVLLPASTQPKSAEPAPRRLTPVGEGGRVLLAEDEPALRSLMRRTLERNGFEVTDASGGEVALAIAQRWKPDILVTDVVMPNMSGRVLAVRLRALYPDVPVLYISGYTDDAVLRHGILEDRDQFMVKPFSSVALVDQVRRMLALRRSAPAEA